MATIDKDARELVLEPKELHFTGPPLRATLTLITLKNNNKFDVMYKFKTNAPNIYRVRPNIGFVRSQGESVVRIVLLPFCPLQLKERLVHNFLVLTAQTPTPDCTDLQKAWQELDEAKIRAVKFKSIIDVKSPLPRVSLDVSSPSSSVADYELDSALTLVDGGSSKSASCARYRFPNKLNYIGTLSSSKSYLNHKASLLAQMHEENLALRKINNELSRRYKELALELLQRKSCSKIATYKVEANTSANAPPRESSADAPPPEVSGSDKFKKFFAPSLTMAIIFAIIGSYFFRG